MLKILLVMFILDGDVHTFALEADTPAQCIVLQANTQSILTQILPRKPQFFASACADVMPVVTAL